MEKITISKPQAKLVLKSLKEIQDRLDVVCRISDDAKEIKSAEKQMTELTKLIDTIDAQTNTQDSKTKSAKKRAKTRKHGLVPDQTV